MNNVTVSSSAAANHHKSEQFTVSITLVRVWKYHKSEQFTVFFTPLKYADYSLNSKYMLFIQHRVDLGDIRESNVCWPQAVKCVMHANKVQAIHLKLDLHLNGEKMFMIKLIECKHFTLFSLQSAPKWCQFKFASKIEMFWNLGNKCWGTDVPK